MTKEEARVVVNAISRIAEARATIALNIFCDNAENAAKNTEILGRLEQFLVDLLSPHTV